MKLGFSIQKFLVLILCLGSSIEARAGLFELSGTFSYSQSKFGAASFQWSRRWGASIGYYFFATSEIEFSVQDIFYRTMISGVEDTSYHDQVYSVEWVQAFTPRSSIIQPYLKLGLGQLNREATGSYLGGASPPSIYDSLTVVLGAGLKVTVFKVLSLRAEATTYLAGGVLSTWQDDFAINGGVSIYF